MCGRFALAVPRERVLDLFGLETCAEFRARYNIAPLTPVLVVRADAAGARTGVLHRWGLLPGWAKDPTLAAKLINARSETVAGKPAFRSAFRRWRCLIPASGFYEWKAIEERGRPIKQPFFICPAADDELFAFAGLTERWVSPEGAEIHSCCILTTAANDRMAPIHDRMPVLLAPADHDAWLDPSTTDPERLLAFLKPAPSEGMVAYPVSRAVNASKNESPDLIEPV